MVKSIKIDVFCDEIKESPTTGLNKQNENWIYIGFLFIPVHKKIQIFEDLMKRRCKNLNNWEECTLNCDYHKKNGIEIHYQALRSADIYFISKEWLSYFIDSKDIRFYFVGINTTRMNYSFFGDVKGAERYNRIYNRLFRTALQKSAKTFYSNYEEIIIRKIIHDNADIDKHEYFPWHSIFKLNNEDRKLTFKTEKIQFLDSNHNISGDKNSHFIQMTDLLMGLFYNTFHNTSKNDKAQELTGYVAEICKQLSEGKNKPYNLFGKIDLDFFPKDKIETNDSLENESKRLHSFYKKRKLLYFDDVNQQELF